MTPHQDNIISIKNLVFSYSNTPSFSLTIDELTIKKHHHVFLEGPSGTGKSTLLNLITGLIQPNQGNINILQTPINTLPRHTMDTFRVDHFGIIFQLFNLIPYLSVIENIMLPCTFSKRRLRNTQLLRSTIHDEAIRLCHALDITHTLQHTHVTKLSIGQQQRTAIARSLIGKPDIIIADEPTSALDQNRKNRFIDLLFTECETYGATLIFVSHDHTLKHHFDSVIHIDQLNKTPMMDPINCH
jgi:putative ABC transport system ATP-binding protein